MRLTIKQTQALDYLEDSTTRELLFGGGAGGGKSALGCYWLLKMCLKYPGTRWLMGRSEMKTLKETTLNTFFEICGKQGLKGEVHYRYREHKSTIFFHNGSEILLKDLFQYPSDPNFDSLGSLEISGAFIDECNQVVKKAWNIVKSRIRYKIDQYGIVPKMLGTCNPAKNFVFYDFYKPWKQNELPQGRCFIQSLVADNPNLSDFYRQNLLTLDKASRERLLFGNWEYDDDPALLVSYDKILETFSNSFVPIGEKYITADIARYGKDKTVIGVWNGLRVEKIITIDHSGTNVVREQIQKLRHEYHIPLLNVVVDEDGVGGGVKDELGCRGFVNNASPIVTKKFEYNEEGDSVRNTENYRNLKSQCAFGLADWINRNQIYIQAESEQKEAIIEELGYLKKRAVDNDNKQEILRKDEIKELLGRSPDYFDMLLMRKYFDLVKSQGGFII
ncbi:MAG: phage terminase large subunit [Leadbetterella sp.]